jgi:enoyl-CoA hydratase
VGAEEALEIGLVNRLVEPGTALKAAVDLALRLADFPQRALRADRQSLLRQWSLNLDEAMNAEFRGGLDVIASGEAEEGARRFAEGSGRHGS